MYKFNSQSKGLGETFDVVLTGGSPWGFTLQGGSEFRTKLSVLKVTPGGKADLSQTIAVGDEIVAINGIECQSRAEAIELVRCSRQKLKIALRREGGAPGPANHSNGAVIKKSSEVPNLYKTASELLSSSDFYSTFNVDKQKFAEITQNKKPSNIYDSTDNLSASHENLLESYRQAEKPPNVSNSSIMEETTDRLSRSSTEMANGRTSPAEVDGLSGVSLPEGHWPVMHQRTHTSPGRIQKVMVKSTNIAVSPTGRETENQQTARSSVNPKNSDDWVGRWLMDTPQQAPPHQTGSVNAGSASLDYKDIPDRRISLHERPDVNKSQSLPRSKSFGGPTSYGVTVTATAVKWNESSNTLNHPRAPHRYSSSNLMQEKQVRDARPDDTSPRQSEMPRNSLVYATPGDTVEVRLPRDTMGPKMTTSESTSSLDSVGTMDSSVGGSRRQGPAPPPRRSQSKLLSSFRTRDRRRPLEEAQIPARFGAVLRIPEIAADQPKHTVSRSWPTDHVAESKPAGSEVTRQSWHAEPTVMTDYSRREANSSVSSTSSDVTPERKLSKSSSLRYSSSVVIRNMRSSSSSSVDEKSSVPTVYRSGQVVPEAGQIYPNNRSNTLPARKKLSDTNPPVKSSGDVGRWPPQNERETEKSRIEDTQILQRLMKDNVTNVETSPSVKSRIANFEGGLKQASAGAPSQERSLFHQQRSFSQGRIDITQQPLKESPVSQSSSMDSLLETRPPTRFSASSASTEQQRSPLQSDRGPTKQWEAIDNTERGRSDENYKRPSPNTFSIKNNPGTREPRRDIEPSSPVHLERQQAFEEEPFRKFESSVRVENKVNAAMERTDPVNDKRLLISNIIESDLNKKPAEEEPVPPSNNDDNEVFWDADDSFPPPPPLHLLDPLETSQDSLPLPSPPREVLVEFPPSYNDYDSRQNNPVQKETFQQNGEGNNDIIKPEETTKVESSVEIGEGPKLELNGPGNVDTSGVSDQPFETSSSTDLSSKETSPAEAKTRSTQRAPPPAPLLITSTPTKDEPDERGTYLNVSTSPYSAGSNTSTPSSSRPNSMLSPKLEALDKEKADLVESMKQKIIDLQSQMNEIKDEIDSNEDLGRKVTKVVERKASAAEFSKYQLFTGELNKIIGLLLILTQRMHRYEMMLNDLDMSEEADRQQRDVLQDKIEKVTMQHEEACKIKEVNDKRGEVVSKILENCLEEEEFADFQYYIDMKTQLALMHAEIRDKVKMGEERLNTLHSTKIDWSILSLT